MPPHVPPPHPPIAPRAQRPVLPWALGMLTLIVGVTALAYALIPGAMGTSAASLAPPAAEQGPTPVAPDDGIGPGTWIVGVDITPGTYRTAGAAPGEFCRWSTYDGRSSNSDLIDFGSADAVGEQLAVEIGDDVGAFQTSGCEPWRLVA